MEKILYLAVALVDSGRSALRGVRTTALPGALDQRDEIADRSPVRGLQ